MLKKPRVVGLHYSFAFDNRRPLSFSDYIYTHTHRVVSREYIEYSQSKIMLFNDETSSLLKKQHHQRDDLESNTGVVPSPDDDELFRGGSTNKTLKTKTHATKKFVVAIGALCVGGSALAVSTSSSSSSSSLRMFNTSRLGGEEEFETAGGTQNFSENGVDESELLIDAKGTQYRGKQTKSVTGKDCKNWVQTTMHPDDHPNDGLYENYCRNPQGQQETIFCFVG